MSVQISMQPTVQQSPALYRRRFISFEVHKREPVSRFFTIKLSLEPWESVEDSEYSLL